MANFPTKGAGLSRGESPSLYEIDTEDNANKADTDGGYEFRRRRFTRARRRTVTTGFIGLTHVDYLTLNAFWDTHQTDTAFSYFDYMHNVTRQVRFDEFKPDYVGAGNNRRWTVKIKMSEI